LIVSVVELKGSYPNIGLKQSKKIKTSMLLEQFNLLQTLSTNSNSTKAQEVLKTVSPGILEELGLEMELDLIVKFYSGYDVSFPPMGCTTSLHTVVYSPKDLSLIIGVGENCAPIMVSLKDYLDETLTLPAVIKGKININGFLWISYFSISSRCHFEC